MSPSFELTNFGTMVSSFQIQGWFEFWRTDLFLATMSLSFQGLIRLEVTFFFQSIEEIIYIIYKIQSTNRDTTLIVLVHERTKSNNSTNTRYKPIIGQKQIKEGKTHLRGEHPHASGEI